MYTNNDHIQEWIASGQAFLIPTEVGDKFCDYVESLPWNQLGTGLDWNQIGGTRIVLSALNPLERINWIASTAMNEDSHVMLWYKRGEPCIACEKHFSIEHIDEAYWMAPGTRYICGASLRDGKIEPRFQNFAEYNGLDQLVAALRCMSR